MTRLMSLIASSSSSTAGLGEAVAELRDAEQMVLGDGVPTEPWWRRTWDGL